MMRIPILSLTSKKQKVTLYLLGLLLTLGLSGSASLLLSGCQTVDPEPSETILRLKLDDSLSRYDLVIVTLIDPADTNRVYETVWSGPLSEPSSQLSQYSLKAAKGKDFIVKVSGYAGGNQLLLQTMISYVGGKKSVSHSTVPAYRPRNKLKSLAPSIGNLVPKFNPDSTQYRIILPSEPATLTLSMSGEYDGAKILLGDEKINSGIPSSAINFGTDPDTLSLKVTDSSQGIAYTLDYTLIVQPTLPSKAQLASIVPSIGFLVPAFNPDSTSYYLHYPAGTSSITLTLRTTDPSSMIIIQDGQVVSEGVPSRPLNAAAARPPATALEVRRGSASNYYLVYLLREAGP